MASKFFKIALFVFVFFALASCSSDHKSDNGGGGGKDKPNVKGETITKLPDGMHVGQSYPVAFQFNNTGNAAATVVKIDYYGSPGYELSNNCGTSLDTNNSCKIEGTFTPQQSEQGKQASVGVKFNYQGGIADVSTTGNVLSGAQVIGKIIKGFETSMQVGNDYPVNFEFTNDSDEDATGVTTEATDLQGYHETSNNCGATLASKASCDIQGTFTPTSEQAGQQVSLTQKFSYQQNPTVTLTTSGKVASGGPTKIEGKVVTPLPPSIDDFTQPKSYPVNIEFTNTGSATAGDVSITSNYPPGFKQTDDSCTEKKNLSPGDSCNVKGDYYPKSVGDIKVQVTLKYDDDQDGVSVETNTKISGRTVTFINHTSFPVWFAVSGSSLKAYGDVVPDNCNTENSCPHGSSCHLSKNEKGEETGICYWDNPQPSDNNYKLPPGGKNVIIISDTSPIEQEVGKIVWNGGFAGRTGCLDENGNPKNCDSATCAIVERDGKPFDYDDGTKPCSLAHSFRVPFTAAEINLLYTKEDTYDIQIIDSINIGVSISPDNGNQHSRPENTIEAFWCKIPGDPADQGFGLHACDWNFEAHLEQKSINPAYFRYVTADGESCVPTNENACSGGEKCGISYNPNANKISFTCGKIIGYWDPKILCSYPSPDVLSQEISDHYQCQKPLPAEYNNLTYTSLYYCEPPKKDQGLLNTCYAYDTDTCCGCINWPTNPPGAKQCLGNSNIWRNVVLGDDQANPISNLYWKKAACPTAYVYPFDDPSATFTCNSADKIGEVNKTNYTVNFYPIND